jgi:hypothetical protein
MSTCRVIANRAYLVMWGLNVGSYTCDERYGCRERPGMVPCKVLKSVESRHIWAFTRLERLSIVLYKSSAWTRV